MHSLAINNYSMPLRWLSVSEDCVAICCGEFVPVQTLFFVRRKSGIGEFDLIAAKRLKFPLWFQSKFAQRFLFLKARL